MSILRAAQEYGIEQNLTAYKAMEPTTLISRTPKYRGYTYGASNQIRNIDEQLKQLNQQGNETLMYVGRTIPELASRTLPQQLDEIETRLALLRAKYLIKMIPLPGCLSSILIDIFKRQTWLPLCQTLSSSSSEIAERPKGV